MESNKLHDHRNRKGGKQDTGNDDDDEVQGPALEQGRIDSSLKLSQKCLNENVLVYIINNVLPTHHADISSFITFVTHSTFGCLAPACCQNVTKQLEVRFEEWKSELVKILSNVDTVCTTLDYLSSRRHSFFGLIVYWLDKESLQRKSACFALCQINGHTILMM